MIYAHGNVTIKRTKDLNYFSLCALDLFNKRVSQLQLNYWNKLTFPWHSNLLRCTCICTSAAVSSVEIRVGQLAYSTGSMFSAKLQGCLSPHAISPDWIALTQLWVPRFSLCLSIDLCPQNLKWPWSKWIYAWNACQYPICSVFVQCSSMGLDLWKTCNWVTWFRVKVPDMFSLCFYCQWKGH